MRFEPISLTCERTAPFNPFTTDETTTMAVMAITMASVVKDERSLLARMVSIAMRTFSPTPPFMGYSSDRSATMGSSKAARRAG